MGEVDGEALRRLYGGDRRLHIAGNAEIVAVDMRRVWHAEIGDRFLQRLHDGAGRDAVIGHLVVEIEGAGVELEGFGAARIDDLETDRLGMLERPGDIVFQLVAAGAPAAEQLERVVVIAEDHEPRHVDDGDRGELGLRLDGVGRDHRRLDHRGVAHLRIADAGGVRAPGGRRGQDRLALCGGERRKLRHQLAPEGDVGTGDMGVHVDGAGHDDLAADVVDLVGLAAFGLGDDAVVLDEEIADFVAVMDGIDDAAAFELDEHQAASRSSISSPMRLSTEATVGLASLGLVALTMPIPEIGVR